MKKRIEKPKPTLPKARTGIQGLDELTAGGLPQGRPTLLCGNAGCGKTLIAMEFLVRGATQFGEPGVFLAFEESAEDLTQNFASLGYDLKTLVAQKKLAVEFVRVERSEMEETGEYDLEGLFIRLGHTIDRIGAKRVVLDTIETLFGGLTNAAILRAELRRLFCWLKDKGMTAIITAERGDQTLTRHGLEEYVADCVILLDHRIVENIATRRLRIVKYRGSRHGTSEYPFLIDDSGMSLLPITSIGLKHATSNERVSTGVPGLDAMMGGKGYFRGSSVLVSGTAGSGKTSLAAHFTAAAAARGERCLWFAFEESPGQIIRNMRSIGIDLEAAVRRGRLHLHAERPTLSGIELHLLTIHKLVQEFNPRVVVIDPITNFSPVGTWAEVEGMLMRLLDFFKLNEITALFTSLTTGGNALETTNVGVSSLMDSWLVLRDLQSGAERNRVMHLLKSRGMAHSNQMREFLLTERGVVLRDPYLGPSGEMLTGSARLAVEAQEKAQAVMREQETAGWKRKLERRRCALEAQIESLRAEFEAEEAELLKTMDQGKLRARVLSEERLQLAQHRQVTPAN